MFQAELGAAKVYTNFQKKRAYLRCPKKQARSQLSKYRFQNESVLDNKLEQAAELFWNRYFENCGRACFFGHLIFLLTDCILLHSLE